MKRTARICSSVCTAVLVIALPVHAQQINQSDITGVGTTGSAIAGGMFSPGPATVAANASPVVTAAIIAVGTSIATQLGAGTLTVTTAEGAPAALPASVQATVLTVLTGGSDVPAGFVGALGSGGADGPAAALALALQGLITAPATGQLSTAVSHLNALVNDSSPAFLRSPPAEFLAVQAVLAQMVAAAQSAG